ncbi:hypothetical protein CJP46_30555 [Paenibacillus sp. XY044]|nr:hypothetical protein CJP46_30555 [Paenibacillus sp. XY044]
MAEVFLAIVIASASLKSDPFNHLQKTMNGKSRRYCPSESGIAALEDSAGCSCPKSPGSCRFEHLRAKAREVEPAGCSRYLYGVLRRACIFVLLVAKQRWYRERTTFRPLRTKGFFVFWAKLIL